MKSLPALRPLLTIIPVDGGILFSQGLNRMTLSLESVYSLALTIQDEDKEFLKSSKKNPWMVTEYITLQPNEETFSPESLKTESISTFPKVIDSSWFLVIQEDDQKITIAFKLLITTALAFSKQELIKEEATD